ncbi:MAG: response regulator [Candidatus Zipacnadales bacterium]
MPSYATVDWGEGSFGETAPAPQCCGEVRRVLVVDDEPAVREVIARWLSAEGYACQVAIDGEEGCRFLQEGPYDLVICDIMMPGLSGLEFLSFIKRTCPQTAVVLVTALDDRQIAASAFKRGAHGYLFKPLCRDGVIQAASHALKRQSLSM